MGMGKLAAPSTIFKRKFRWGLVITPKCGSVGEIPEYMVKVASRPNLSLEETEIHSKNGKMYIPGKASWETITVTFYDIVGSEVNSEVGSLYNWIIAMYNFIDTAGIRGPLQMADSIDQYAGVAVLTMYSGCGEPLEIWTLKDAWPQAINFGDLDYSSSEEATIEMTLRYCDVTYEAKCATVTKPDCCSVCQ
jgi:hypothetical protein